MAQDDRTRLIVVAGGTTAVAAEALEQVIARMRVEQPGTVVLHHDLREVGQGVVRRRLRTDGSDDTTVLELAHGCVSCTLREDVLPMLRALGRRPDVRGVVLHLDAAVEPEQVCWTLLHVALDDGVLDDGVRDDGAERALVTDTLDLCGVVSVLDAGCWLDDAGADDEVGERGLAPLPDDERTIAQLVVGHAEFADLLVLAGPAEPWVLARTDAVLARLAPLAPRLVTADLDRRVLLEDLPDGARRGRPDHPHAALLRGQPPLDGDSDIRMITFTARRPFHPERLHGAIDVLLQGVVRARGRIWLATRPEACLWLESAGGGLQVGHVGDWLAAEGDEAWGQADPERRAAAALRWHPRWGDRVQELAILVDGADPDDIDAVLREALLNDLELAAGEPAWQHFDDPFGFWHTEPCAESDAHPSAGRGRGEGHV
ncbi:ribosome hibernation factor-recruiting GTPase MRF [Pseudonocardia sichuanensis]|uniref:G3E family GTPase n=1 Tax=Pseudonocardia kunmingensis TaxID=630975 RepID=A0A543D9Q1_9PSEU|nr:GTP-binding protein [Pseudonocardia kunmingensis]TQM06073.1 G3E family GTPase [Pseudonocardia kunmingensis]